MYDKTTTLLRSPATFVSETDGLLRRKWTVEECRFLVKSELLEVGKFELLDGEIIYKMGQSLEHRACVTGIVATVSAAFELLRIQHQGGVDIGERDPYNDPEPDVAIYKERVRSYIAKGVNPATDIVLVVEASLTSLASDKTKKARVYGQQGIPEYWIVAIENRTLTVHREPNTTGGGYADVRTYAETDSVSPLARPDVALAVADLLP